LRYRRGCCASLGPNSPSSVLLQALHTEARAPSLPRGPWGQHVVLHKAATWQRTSPLCARLVARL
jgi:hypothetical protein